jgi:hypothetical protein
VSRRKVADIQANPREACDLRHFSFAQKSIGDTALIENFDGARVQAAGARAREILVGPPLDNGKVDAGQRQFARQHQTGRAGSGDHHSVAGVSARLARPIHRR